MQEKEALYDIKDGIAYITLNRPEKLNAIDPAMRQLLWDAFQDVKHNPEVRCAIVTGNGRAFSTGHDLVAMAAARANEGPSTGVEDPIAVTIGGRVTGDLAAVENQVSIAIGSAVGDRVIYPRAPPGDVRDRLRRTPKPTSPYPQQHGPNGDPR